MICVVSTINPIKEKFLDFVFHNLSSFPLTRRQGCNVYLIHSTVCKYVHKLKLQKFCLQTNQLVPNLISVIWRAGNVRLLRVMFRIFLLFLFYFFLLSIEIIVVTEHGSRPLRLSNCRIHYVWFYCCRHSGFLRRVFTVSPPFCAIFALFAVKNTVNWNCSRRTVRVSHVSSAIGKFKVQFAKFFESSSFKTGLIKFFPSFKVGTFVHLLSFVRYWVFSWKNSIYVCVCRVGDLQLFARLCTFSSIELFYMRIFLDSNKSDWSFATVSVITRIHICN